uniref:Uncharacterized protein n=1 Tax=Eutreptiella gymnastica TaxID=73025 RepID=A0A7S1IQ78_9EUGL|mmetsp:Transcript_33490/g.60046  ORF Transcript_33490/g.60046 Transcript_33490/m.60046 type:complete len:100 (+) Transcript_33490:328-627(+)
MQTCTTTTNDGPHDFAISEVQRMQGLNVKHPRNITISIECIHCIIYLHRNLQNWLIPTLKTKHSCTLSEVLVQSLASYFNGQSFVCAIIICTHFGNLST